MANYNKKHQKRFLIFIALLFIFSFPVKAGSGNKAYSDIVFCAADTPAHVCALEEAVPFIVADLNKDEKISLFEARSFLRKAIKIATDEEEKLIGQNISEGLELSLPICRHILRISVKIERLDSDKIWYEEILPELIMSNNIVDDKRFYYYSDDENGVFRYDTITNLQQLVVSGVGANSCFVDGDKIYYTLNNSTQIWRADKQGAQQELLFDVKDHADLLETDTISNVFIYRDMLYFKDSGASYLRHSLTINVTERFLDDVNSMSIIGDIVCYTKHAERSFAIYEKDINDINKPEKLILGDNRDKKQLSIDEPGLKYDLYDALVNVNEELYFTNRTEKSVRRFNESGEHELVYDFSYIKGEFCIIYLYSYKGQLVFMLNTPDEEKSVYVFDTETKTARQVVMPEDFLRADTEIKIIDNIIFYKADNQLKYSYLNN